MFLFLLFGSRFDVSESQDVCLFRDGVHCCACPRAAASPTCQGIPTLRITARFPFSALAPPCPGISSPAPPGCERRQTLPPDAVSSALLLLKELCESIRYFFYVKHSLVYSGKDTQNFRIKHSRINFIVIARMKKHAGISTG